MLYTTTLNPRPQTQTSNKLENRNPLHMDHDNDCKGTGPGRARSPGQPNHGFPYTLNPQPSVNILRIQIVKAATKSVSAEQGPLWATKPRVTHLSLELSKLFKPETRESPHICYDSNSRGKNCGGATSSVGE